VSYGSLKTRWRHGVAWTWINENYRALLPEKFVTKVMSLESQDRFHKKQGRSTARVVLHEADHTLPVYLKRHFHLPWPARVAALFDPAGRHSPAAAEWVHLERVRTLGINVPEVVAAGERIGPRAGLQSFLMIAELTGATAVNELLPGLATRLDRAALAALKRRVVAEMARITATLHRASVFHKDLYLCHFFLDANGDGEGSKEPKLSLIDLHRLEEHRYIGDWWRWKDLGQLLYSTEGVVGISKRDCSRFWISYCRLAGIKRPGLHARMIRLRAARYSGHNRKRR
jgi:heptose I phosphotransferase